MSIGETGITHWTCAALPALGPLIGGVLSGLILTSAF